MNEDDEQEECRVCSHLIEVMAFKGTRFCSQLCRNEWNESKPSSYWQQKVMDGALYVYQASGKNMNWVDGNKLQVIPTATWTKVL